MFVLKVLLFEKDLLEPIDFKSLTDLPFDLLNPLLDSTGRYPVTFSYEMSLEIKGLKC